MEFFYFQLCFVWDAWCTFGVMSSIAKWLHWDHLPSSGLILQQFILNVFLHPSADCTLQFHISSAFPLIHGVQIWLDSNCPFLFCYSWMFWGRWTACILEICRSQRGKKNILNVLRPSGWTLFCILATLDFIFQLWPYIWLHWVNVVPALAVFFLYLHICYTGLSLVCIFISMKRRFTRHVELCLQFWWLVAACLVPLARLCKKKELIGNSWLWRWRRPDHVDDENVASTSNGDDMKKLMYPCDKQEPQLTDEQRVELDGIADKIEIQRLLGMGVLLNASCLDGIAHKQLATKFVRTWRDKEMAIDGKPTRVWVRRSRFVAREFAWLFDDKQSMFSPASSSISSRILPVIFLQHRDDDWVLMSCDVQDAFLTVKQRDPTMIVAKDAAGNEQPYALGRILPWQRAGSQLWNEDITNHLKQTLDMVECEN